MTKDREKVGFGQHREIVFKKASPSFPRGLV
jgi:hypothetical protein